jgi:glucose-6-phosphate dehydrogenase assembly protein OpcA
VAQDLNGASGRAPGDIIAVGIRAPGGGRVELADPARPGEATMRWASSAHSIEEIEHELARIWAQPNLVLEMDDERAGRHIAARTSVMNLVVVARAQETGERAAGTIEGLTGRHPSRTLVLLAADPDGPPWLDARIQAHCVLPRPDAPETCSELIFLTAGGQSGQHLGALVTPLLIHDLPVTTWWPGDPPLASDPAAELLDATDRLVVDGSTWGNDGMVRLGELAQLYDRYPRLSIRDFAFVRQTRWREAMASVFDVPDFRPYVHHVKRVSVAYATSDATGAPGTTNIVKPLYHVAWLASRLGMRVAAPLAPVERASTSAAAKAASKAAARLHPGEKAPLHRGLAARLRHGSSEAGVVIRPVASSAAPGTTLRVEITCERRGSELRLDVTAEADSVHVRTYLDGVQAIDRTYKAARLTDGELLGETLDGTGRDPVSMGAIRVAAELGAPRVAEGA